MKRVVVVPLHAEADLAHATAALESLRGEPPITIVLDLHDPSGLGGPGRLRAFLEFTQGMAGAEGHEAHVACPLPRPVGLAPIPWRPRIADCLAAAAPPSGPPVEVMLTLPARLEYLAPVRKHFAGIVRALHGDADAFQAEILVDELCLNAVENSPSTRSTYDVRFLCGGHELQIDVTNRFDAEIEPLRVMHRRLESFDDSGGYLGERGRGLFLIARIADGLQIRSLDGDRIRVTVLKRLSGP